MSNDTIVAVATAPGVGGIAVVRLSGPDALSIATSHLAPSTFASSSSAAEAHLPPFTFHLSPRTATYCRFGELDDVVVTWYPRGYTGEPTVEIACHGSTYIQQAIVQTLCESGARIAEPGEFTMRAFLNGRMNLAQAEAVADLIEAATPAQHRLAVSQLRGGYASKLKELRQQLVDLTSLFELELDFSQEDVEFADRKKLHTLLRTLDSELKTLLDSFAMGNAVKRGIPVAIVGRPNAGKSSLLNALLGDDRAIVSPVPGTTRDTVEETLVIGGLTFRFIDTAGLRHSDDPVEALGIERSLRAIDEAMLVLHVTDATAPESEDPIATEKEVVRVLNKCDLVPMTDDDKHVCISAKTGMGIERLKQAMLDRVGSAAATEVMLTNARHRDALRLVAQALANAETGLKAGTPSDLVAVDLRDALYHLGTITGEVTSNDLLANIFGRFCVGK